MKDTTQYKMPWRVIIVTSIILLFLYLGNLAFWPIYRVWEQGKSGEAKLKEAEFSRQVTIVEAQAKLEAEKLNAQSEVVRSEGVAKSNQIISTSINEQYIRYLWVKTLDGAEKQIIYVPTEANLPLTEAGRTPRP